MIDTATAAEMAAVAGVILGVILPQFVNSANAQVHKVVTIVMSIIAILGLLATSGSVVVPAFVVPLWIAYNAALIYENNQTQAENNVMLKGLMALQKKE